MSSLKQFNFESMKEIHYGSINREIDSALRTAYLDCDDRPGVSEARTVTLTIKMKPVSDDSGKLCQVGVDFEVKKNMPKKGVGVLMKPVINDTGGGLMFQPDVPDNPNQEPLPFPKDQM